MIGRRASLAALRSTNMLAPLKRPAGNPTSMHSLADASWSLAPYYRGSCRSKLSWTSSLVPTWSVTSTDIGLSSYPTNFQQYVFQLDVMIILTIYRPRRCLSIWFLTLTWVLGANSWYTPMDYSTARKLGEIHPQMEERATQNISHSLEASLLPLSLRA